METETYEKKHKLHKLIKNNMLSPAYPAPTYFTREQGKGAVAHSADGITESQATAPSLGDLSGRGPRTGKVFERCPTLGDSTRLTNQLNDEPK